jgi:hypothetical protein
MDDVDVSRMLDYCKDIFTYPANSQTKPIREAKTWPNVLTS